MSEYDKHVEGIWKRKLILYGMIIVMLILGLIGVADGFARYAVDIGIEWIGMSNTGLMVIGFGGAIVLFVMDSLIDRAFYKYLEKAKNLKENQG